jgi:ATP-dependent Clp protease ATP-binding subunit ClpA
MREVKRRFPPEFLNRIDEIVFFQPLDHRAICRIARLQLAGLVRSLAAQGKELVITEDAMNRLAEEGYSFEFGARNLGRILRQRILDPLALTSLSPEWAGARRVVIDRDREGLVLQLDPEAAPGALLPLEANEAPMEDDPPAAS